MKGLVTRRLARSLSSQIQGASYTPREATIYDFIHNACEKNDSKLMASFEMHKKTFTFGEMHLEAGKIAAGLVNLGIAPGDRVAVWGPNQPEWLVMKWACARAGFEMVNINPLYTSRELEYALEKVDAKMLVCPKTIGPLNYHAKVQEMIPNLAEQDRFSLNVPSVPTLKKVVYYSCPEAEAGTFQWSELEQAGSDKDLTTVNEIVVDPHSIANIQFTSGTTGMPKAASLSHFNLINNAISLTESLNSLVPSVHENSSFLNVLPLYHVFSFVGGSLIGAHNVVPNIYPAPGFNSSASILACAARKCTYLIGTPTMFTDIVNDPIRPDHDISSLDYAIVGGAPATPALVRKANTELGLQMAVGYGMTENSCATFLTYPGSTEDVTCNSVGFPIPGVEAKVIDENENTLERGQIGELVTKGFVLFKGYVKDEEKTKESYTKDGYWKTGDLAQVREDGTLQISGRSKDMLIRGGENIQPTEIENFITTHEKVLDCYVIGVPSSRLGEEVAAYIQLKDDSVTKEDIISFCKEGLARYKLPKYIQFTDEFPKTVTGKIQKFLLREQAMEDFPELKDELAAMQ